MGRTRTNISQIEPGTNGDFAVTNGTPQAVWQSRAALGLITVSDATAIDSNARVAVRKNSTGSVYTRRRINFIEGSGITFTITDDSGDEEVDVQVDAAGGSAEDARIRAFFMW